MGRIALAGRGFAWRNWMVAAAGIGSVVAMTPAHADDTQTGSRLAPRTEDGLKLKQDAAIRDSHLFYKCLFARRDRAAIRLLTTLDEADYADAHRTLSAYAECMAGFEGEGGMTDSLTFSNSAPSMRGLLAESALEMKGNLKANAPDLPALPMAEGYARSWFAMTGRPSSVDAMATCFAETQPGVTKALLKTAPTSKEEMAAIRQVAGLLGPCLISGASLNANVFTLRGALAEAYFHRIYGPAEPAVATTAPSK